MAWVNDEGSLHTYGRKTDAYKILGKCSMGGNPPDDWLSVLQACQNDGKEHP
ncbi:type II toxin-antitoxin system YhaV family toxin [Citrobacter amalonaticus]|uniref:type II toxin-antitoxin system YhaV family toxin n=1 Tax=Citrobacter amalonaticus TaxID=35703 RepID=UPI0039A70E96